MAARIRARLAQEDGFTLPELLTSMAILAFVLTAVLGMFVSGLRAEVDMNNRFQAQQDARLALTSMRQDVRTACSAAVSGNVVPGDTVELGFCSSASTSWSSTPVSWTTWCVRDEGGSPAHYGLFRESVDDASCAAGTAGIREADWLTGDVTTNPVFTYLPAAVGSGQRSNLQVTVPVDANPATSGTGVYKLSDTIMLRNAPAS